MLCKELHIVLIEFLCWYFPYIFIQSLLALFLVTQTNWVQNSLPKYTVCLCRQERLITPQNLLCLWSKITRNASLSMVCSHIRPLNLCQMPLRNFGQKRELQYLEKYVLSCRKKKKNCAKSPVRNFGQKHEIQYLEKYAK